MKTINSPWSTIQPDGSLLIWIPMPTPSGNKYAYSHWTVRQKDKMIWRRMICASMSEDFRKSNEAKSKKYLCIKRISNRKLDVDNGYSGLKGIIDIIKDMKLIVDDNEDNIELGFFQLKKEKSEDSCTIITIEDIK